ncbi:MAG: hypothetical protein JWM16_269 [Verrucomicrobiales bacterium]|nr:hypothetical protein [Verrucomicrobiales bacterium]
MIWGPLEAQLNYKNSSRHYIEAYTPIANLDLLPEPAQAFRHEYRQSICVGTVQSAVATA